MNVWIACLLILVECVIKSTFLQFLSISGILPNISICFIVAYSLLRGSIKGCLFAFFLGILQDLLFMNTIGFHALVFMAIAYASGLFQQDFYAENYLLPFMLTVIFDFIYLEIVYLTRFLPVSLDFVYFLYKIIVPEIIYTSVFSFLIYRMMYALNDKMKRYE